MVDGLFLVPANRIDQFNQFPVEDGGGAVDQLLLGFPASAWGRFGIVVGYRLDFPRFRLNAVRVDGGQQIADDVGEFNAAGLFLDAFLVPVAELPVQPGETARQGTDRVLVANAHHHAHGEILERRRRFGDKRLSVRLDRLGDADGIDDHIVRLGGRGGRRDLLQVVIVEGARAAALHLLKVIAALHVAHEKQALKRLDVGAGGDHVHGHGDARIVVVAKLGENGLGVFLNPVGDLLAEFIAFGEFLAHGLDDVVGVAVGLGENQRFRHFAPARKYLR
ncbi:MAG: hypothetical protein M2R45_01679 [Verrucomicrobia subdivision 3 bacterium]|nr:hypothetical protein [Limisphaerales bacterium]